MPVRDKSTNFKQCSGGTCCDLNLTLKAGWEKAILIFGDGLERAYQAVKNASAKAFKWEEICCI